MTLAFSEITSGLKSMGLVFIFEYWTGFVAILKIPPGVKFGVFVF